MSFQMSYTTSSGLSATASYWVLNQVVITPVQQTASFSFLGYSSQVAFQERLPPIDSVFFLVRPADFSALIAAVSPLGQLSAALLPYLQTLTTKKSPDAPFFQDAQLIA